jgi:hypothetical protein
MFTFHHVPSTLRKMLMLRSHHDDDDNDDPIELFQTRGKWWELIVFLTVASGKSHVSLEVYS